MGAVILERVKLQIVYQSCAVLRVMGSKQSGHRKEFGCGTCCFGLERHLGSLIKLGRYCCRYSCSNVSLHSCGDRMATFT